MMNNEFVHQQSRHWSERLANLDMAAEEKIQHKGVLTRIMQEP